MEKLTATLTMKIDKLESSVFDLEKERDQVAAAMTSLKGDNAELRGQLDQHCNSGGGKPGF